MERERVSAPTRRHLLEVVFWLVFAGVFGWIISFVTWISWVTSIAAHPWASFDFVCSVLSSAPIIIATCYVLWTDKSEMLYVVVFVGCGALVGVILAPAASMPTAHRIEILFRDPFTAYFPTNVCLAAVAGGILGVVLRRSTRARTCD